MNATLNHKDETTNYSFTIEHEDNKYEVIVYMNSKGKFIDENIYHQDGTELEYEGTEGQIREDIMDYLDQNWDKLA